MQNFNFLIAGTFEHWNLQLEKIITVNPKRKLNSKESTHSNCFYCLCFTWNGRGTDNFSIFRQGQNLSFIFWKLRGWRHRVIDFSCLCDNQRDRSRTMLSIIQGAGIILDSFSLDYGRLEARETYNLIQTYVTTNKETFTSII